ncbi:unnamed protein product [Polarella glacialis]|uniref:ShKT domain-containing protein n=2 Tax=Polarella glacialis TaxID=89957 RepID=A0A813EL62_POLGL|nr:unnamed protein product [Polarella glacialis]
MMLVPFYWAVSAVLVSSQEVVDSPSAQSASLRGATGRGNGTAFFANSADIVELRAESGAGCGGDGAPCFVKGHGGACCSSLSCHEKSAGWNVCLPDRWSCTQHLPDWSCKVIQPGASPSPEPSPAPAPVPAPAPMPVPAPQVCEDESGNCASWASSGECAKNPGYMVLMCRKSCGTCAPSTLNVAQTSSESNSIDFRPETTNGVSMESASISNGTTSISNGTTMPLGEK